jgi:hypothetical protein
MFKVSPASSRTYIDTPNCVLEDRVQYNTVHIPNVFCNHLVHRDFLITLYLLTRWSRVLLEKLTGSQIVEKFPAFNGTERFITAFTSARPPSCSWRNGLQYGG